MSHATEPQGSSTAQCLGTWVHDDFGIDLVALDRVELGADTSAQVWRGTGGDGTSYAVKWSGGGTPAGLLVPAGLAAAGVDGVTAPVRTIDGRCWSERAGRRLSVTPWLSGQRALDGGMTEGHWRAYGVLLARVHATAPSPDVTAVLAPEPAGDDAFARRVRSVDARLRALPHAADDLALALAGTWRRHAAAVTRLLERADELGVRRAARTAPVVVCHSDPHLGNVVLGHRDQVWLLDWDDAVLAPRERDLVFVLGGGVLAFAPVGEREQSWFLEGYGPADLDPVLLAYHRCSRALEDLGSWADDALDAARAQADRVRALDIVRGILSPTGLVAAALR